MALVDPLATRSATVVALQAGVALRVPEYEFSALAEENPDLWRRIAVEIAKRLRERNKQLPVPHNEPVLFIGSSEGLSIAKEVHRRLGMRPVVPKLWSEGVFQLSNTSIESLMGVAREADFAALVLTGDDVTVSRGRRTPSPRDNVIFELGLVMGTLGRDRVFILKPSGVDVRIPSDLFGVTWLEYARAGPKGLRTRMRGPCRKIQDAILRIGPR